MILSLKAIKYLIAFFTHKMDYNVCFRYFQCLNPTMINKYILAFAILWNVANAQTLCVDGLAGAYPCQNTHLLSHISTSDLNGGSATNLNDIWGWTDPLSGREFALVGMSTGTAFVEISDPINPQIIGKLPTHTSNSSWRDIKVYQGHAFIGSEANGHGMQIFDLSQLLNPPIGYQVFTNTAHYAGFGDSHNIVMNESSGFVYAVGANSFSGGLHAVNVTNPTSPVIAGGYSDDGYTHDAQIVNYIGPDTEHLGNEIVFACNANTLTIVDVTDKTDMTTISITGYAGQSYTHQGWLTEDHKYFLMGDELDESQTGVKTTTFIWDVQDLDAPIMIGTYVSSTSAIDHNQYINGQWTYQSNYRAGLRILDISDVASANLKEVAFFDTYVSNDNANFSGTWSNYPYFDSNNVVISDIGSGLFIVRPVMAEISLTSNPCPGQNITYSLEVKKGLNGPISISANGLPTGVTYALSNMSPVAGEVVTLTLSNISQAPVGNTFFNVVFSDGDIDHVEEIELKIVPTLLAPSGLSSQVSANTVDLYWDPVPNSIACKVRGRIVGTSGFAGTPIFYSFEPETHIVSMNLLQANKTYEWQVICGCSVSPIVATPWSSFSTFTTPPIIEQNSNEAGELWLQPDEFSLFPNPADEEITILSSSKLGIDKIEIFNSFGEIVFTHNQIEDSSFRINIEQFSKGIYIVKLSENGETFTRKLVVK